MTDIPPDRPVDELTTLLEGDTLPCGHKVDDLLEQVADGRAGQLTQHQQGCVHCQAAISEFTRLWAPVRASPSTSPWTDNVIDGP